MTNEKEALVAYLATLAAIVGLTLAAALIVILATFTKEGELDRVVASLAFIGAAETGLIGVIGTFRPKGPVDASTNTGDVNVGPTTKTTTTP